MSPDATSDYLGVAPFSAIARLDASWHPSPLPRATFGPVLQACLEATPRVYLRAHACHARCRLCPPCDGIARVRDRGTSVRGDGVGAITEIYSARGTIRVR
jgi:hypothetical protein